MFLFLMVLSSFLLLTFNPLFYSLFLIIFSVAVVSHLVTYFFIPRLLGIVILLVYLGSIMVILAYVCAVVPNLSYYFSSFKFYVSLSFLSFFSISCTLFPLINHGSSPTFLLSTFFYGPFGSYIFFPVIFFMVLVLLTSSSYLNISSPFRSS
jgi:hypothetical protein